MKRKIQQPDQPPLLEPPESVSVRLVGGLNPLVRDEADATGMDVSSWIRKACWDALREAEYGAMEKRILASLDVLRTEAAQKQQQIWNGVAATFSVLLQFIETNPNMTVDEGTLAKALQYFNQFRARPASIVPNAAAEPVDRDEQPGRDAGGISFG